MQPTPPGWYLDPKGRPGLYRWFDGRFWTADVTPDRQDRPPRTPELPAPHDDGTFHAGGLSYPAMPEPWEAAPAYLEIDDEIGQQLVVGRTARGPYIACVFIGALPARYGYQGTDDLARAGNALTTDLLNTYYPHETLHDSKEIEEEHVEGHLAWRREVTLDIEDPALDFEHEDAVFAVVDLGDSSAGVFYASLPRVASGDVPDRDGAMRNLHVI